IISPEICKAKIILGIKRYCHVLKNLSSYQRWINIITQLDIFYNEIVSITITSVRKMDLLRSRSGKCTIEIILPRHTIISVLAWNIVAMLQLILVKYQIRRTWRSNTCGPLTIYIQSVIFEAITGR